MNRRTLLGSTLGLGFLVAITSACSGGGSGLASVEVPRRPAEEVIDDRIGAAISHFSGRLLASAGAESNQVMSPLSVLIVLAMVRNGADGQTAQEIDTTLGLPDPEQLNAGMNTTLQTLARRSGPRELGERRADVDVTLAQRAWGQPGTRWEEVFLTALAEWYGSGMAEVDFSDPTRAAQQINAWISEVTDAAITDLVEPSALDPATQLVLANAVHFKAPWQAAFAQPAMQTFSTASGPVEVPMMHSGTGTAYGVGDGWSAALLPYLGGELAMTVVLPDPDRGPALLDQWEQGGVGPVLDSLAPESVQVSMPTFSTRSNSDLVETLTALGMPRLFTPAAELTGMATGQRLMVSSLLHEGWISVDEEGTEAAAATAAVMARSVRIDPRQLILDRPFGWIIHDVQTRLPVLVGWVADPSHTAD